MNGLETPVPGELFDHQKPLILYVEDDDYTFRLMSVALGRGGYRVVQAETAHEGLRMARDERPDLILMDVWLPGAVDGFGATEILKNDRDLGHIPVVVLTAQNTSGVQRRAAAVRCDAFLTKPVSVQKLLTCVNGLVPGRTGS